MTRSFSFFLNLEGSCRLRSKDILKAQDSELRGLCGLLGESWDSKMANGKTADDVPKITWGS